MDSPNFKIDGRVALITGAGRGIGLAIAKALASAGAAVVIQDIEIDVARGEVEQIKRAGGKAAAIGGDITDLAQAKEIIGKAVEPFGGLHILINNAAVQKQEHWLQMSVESMQRQFTGDLMFPIVITQLAADIFKKQKFGRIINIGSIQQKNANAGMLAYSAAKAALERITMAWARDLAGDKITCNCISPGWFDTYRNREDFPNAEEKAKKGKWVPLGRVGEPQDCAGIALLLCSDAGEYITGQNIYVDGGISTR
jgi:glucose 1-dehydrogenase